MSRWQWAWEGVLGVLVVLAVGMVVVTAPTAHLPNVLASAAPLGLVAAGLSLSLRTGVPNLAVGAVSALSGALIATAVEVGEMSLVTGALLVLVLAAFAGLVIGAFTVLVSAPAWAVTLGAAVACEALLVAVTDARVIPVEVPQFPRALWFAVFAVVSVAGGLLWARRDVRERLSKGWTAGLVGLAGSGMLAALGGFVLLMRLGAAQPSSSGTFTTVFALAAVLLGGTSPNGERGAVTGTVFSVLLLSIVQGQLALLNAPFWVYSLILGIVVAVGLAVSRLLDALRP
ncbi:ABC transporter permease [Nonomuraea sp. NPDC049480]|uniref:ABC transporter permease n=1 Tax=Nonomuraea sp. NPDC049480 TaxID=3364353 RepID=UPI0037A24DCC